MKTPVVKAAGSPENPFWFSGVQARVFARSERLGEATCTRAFSPARETARPASAPSRRHPEHKQSFIRILLFRGLERSDNKIGPLGEATCTRACSPA